MPSVPTKSSRKSLNWISRTPSKANNMETKPENACLSRSISSTDFYSPEQPGERTQSIQTNYGYLDIDSISIRLPEGYEIESLPKPVDQESKFGKFRSSITLGDAGNVFYRSSPALSPRQLPQRRLYRFPGFPQSIATQYGAKIILKKSGGNYYYSSPTFS